MEDITEPECGFEDVKIKIHKTAICGTDIHIYNWDHWAQQTIVVPMVIGHEYAGEIVELGSHVHGLEIGQRVSGKAILIVVFAGTALQASYTCVVIQ